MVPKHQIETAQDTASREPMRSALFVDFDNVYSALRSQSLAAASVFAESSGTFLRWLEANVFPTAHGGTTTRRILIRRCYLNPNVFWRFRPHFVHAGFQIVDTPSLTVSGKSGADIVMALDIMDALHATMHYDEFIILSGDSDFAPVLHRIRAQDRRTMMLAVGATSAAYRAVCDFELTEELLIEHALGLQEAPSASSWTHFGGHSDLVRSGQGLEAPRALSTQLALQAVEVIATLVAESPMPVVSARVVEHLRFALGSEDVNAAMREAGGFKEFIERLPLEGFAVDWAIPGFFFDPERHELPAERVSVRVVDPSNPELNVLAQRAHRLTDVPLLSAQDYVAVFRCIADEVQRNGFNLVQTSKALRDTCNERGVSVNRADANFILKGILYGGIDLSQMYGSVSPDRLSAAFADNVINLCGRAQLSLSEQEIDLIRQWIQSPAVTVHGADLEGEEK